MIFFKFKEEKETRTYSDGKPFPCDAFRWVFKTDDYSIGFVHQRRYREKQEWHDSHTRVFELCLSPKWKTPAGWNFGGYHFWYDGPHCMFSLGPITFQWHNGGCKKCLAD